MYTMIVMLATFLSCNGFAQENKNPTITKTFEMDQPGKLNAITDVEGVKIGHTTVINGENVRTGVTAILPHSGNI